jgi:hypothetical protein
LPLCSAGHLPALSVGNLTLVVRLRSVRQTTIS